MEITRILKDPRGGCVAMWEHMVMFPPAVDGGKIGSISMVILVRIGMGIDMTKDRNWEWE